MAKRCELIGAIGERDNIWVKAVQERAIFRAGERTRPGQGPPKRAYPSEPLCSEPDAFLRPSGAGAWLAHGRVWAECLKADVP